MAEAQRLDIPGFVKGINKEADPYLLEEGEVPDAINVDFGQRGEVSRRDGFTRIDVPWETAIPEHRILSWASADDEFLLVLGNSDRKVWIGSIYVA